MAWNWNRTGAGVKPQNFKIYLAKPYHSWQRGLNENTSGLLRRFFPKGAKIGALAKKEIGATQLAINMRPRKTLNYLTLLEFLAGKCVLLIVVPVIQHLGMVVFNRLRIEC